MTNETKFDPLNVCKRERKKVGLLCYEKMSLKCVWNKVWSIECIREKKNVCLLCYKKMVERKERGRKKWFCSVAICNNKL